MSYDKESFMKGLAVGRILWKPPRPIAKDEETFMFTVSATGGTQVSTPYCLFGGVVMWGDGSVESIGGLPSGPVNDPWTYSYRLYHTYADSGEYRIIMIGRLLYFSSCVIPGYIYPSDGCEALVSIDTPYPASMSTLETMACALAKCPNLKKVPGILLKNCRSILSTVAMFRQSGILTVPGDLLKGCSRITDMSAMFQQSELMSIPGELLTDTINVTNVTRMFAVYKGNTIPPNLFNSMGALENVSELFYASSIEGIPASIFANNPNITRFNDAFAYCRYATGEAPPLWEQFPDAAGGWCFEGSINLSNYADIPAGWK